jgi:hypothetical protein
MERFSMREVLKEKYGETEKNTKTAKSTKKVDGVKYMVLK